LIDFTVALISAGMSISRVHTILHRRQYYTAIERSNLK